MVESPLYPGERVVADALNCFMPRNGGYRLNHTMLHIKDPARSLKFYSDFLHMSLIFRLNTGPCTVYYLGYPQPEDTTPLDIAKGMSSRNGLLELVHIHDQTAMEGEDVNGKNNLFLPGFGHLGFNVPDVGELLQRARDHGYEVIKETKDTCGHALQLTTYQTAQEPFHSNFLAAYTQIGFLRDPDGYTIEFLPQVIRR